MASRLCWALRGEKGVGKSQGGRQRTQAEEIKRETHTREKSQERKAKENVQRKDVAKIVRLSENEKWEKGNP